MKTILITDDDMHIGNLLEEALVKEGYEVARAYSGTEAQLLLSKTKPDLILLDLMLPGLSGEELLPQIKDIPVIVVSAKADTSDKVGLLLGGAALTLRWMCIPVMAPMWRLLCAADMICAMV